MEGYGDRLARGFPSAIFGPSPDSKVSDAKWNMAFDDFDPESFKKNGFKAENDASTDKKEQSRP